MVYIQSQRDAFVASATAAWLRHGRRGIVIAASHDERTAVARAVFAAAAGAGVQVLVPTRLLVDAWQGEVSGVEVSTYAQAMRRLGRERPDLYIFDQLQAMGVGLIESLCTAGDGARVLGLAAGVLADRLVWELSPFTGPVLARSELDPITESVHCVLELDLTGEERIAYEAARDHFLAVYDDWRAVVGPTDWRSFVTWARESALGRRALRGWHESRRVLAWTEAKAQVTAEVLRRHRGERLLVLTADKASAYAISREHLVMPLCGDLPLAERRAAIAAFGGGELNVLVAPRLLDDLELKGVDVVIDVARARSRPGVRAALTYELCTRRTVEVARSR